MRPSGSGLLGFFQTLQDVVDQAARCKQGLAAGRAAMLQKFRRYQSLPAGVGFRPRLVQMPADFLWHAWPGFWFGLRLFMLTHLNLPISLSLGGSAYNLSTTVAVAIPCPMHIVCRP